MLHWENFSSSLDPFLVDECIADLVVPGNLLVNPFTLLRLNFRFFKRSLDVFILSLSIAAQRFYLLKMINATGAVRLYLVLHLRIRMHFVFELCSK